VGQRRESDPAPGSLKPWHHARALIIPGRNRCWQSCCRDGLIRRPGSRGWARGGAGIRISSDVNLERGKSLAHHLRPRVPKKPRIERLVALPCCQLLGADVGNLPFSVRSSQTRSRSERGSSANHASPNGQLQASRAQPAAASTGGGRRARGIPSVPIPAVHWIDVSQTGVPHATVDLGDPCRLHASGRGVVDGPRGWPQTMIDNAS